jgi:hypothetical protein
MKQNCPCCLLNVKISRVLNDRGARAKQHDVKRKSNITRSSLMLASKAFVCSECDFFLSTERNYCSSLL